MFIDLENTYDRVRRCTRERYKHKKYAMCVYYMYGGATILVIMTSTGITVQIPLGVGLHLGTTMNPYLCVMIMDVLVCGNEDLSPWCMLCADTHRVV